MTLSMAEFEAARAALAQPAEAEALVDTHEWTDVPFEFAGQQVMMPALRHRETGAITYNAATTAIIMQRLTRLPDPSAELDALRAENARLKTQLKAKSEPDYSRASDRWADYD